jgi:hypothetical protein
MRSNMSRRKIKLEIKKKRPKAVDHSVRKAMEFSRQMKREVRKEDENAEIVALITEEKLDLERQNDYKYMAAIAKEMEWSVGRLMKTTKRVAKLLKQEAKEKEDE